MHQAAYEFVRRAVADYGPYDSVLEIGSRNINGGVRELFVPPAAHYWGIDLVDGLEVDEVADAVTWSPPRTYSAVVCCEVFEHTKDWPEILRTMELATVPGSYIILTMAGPSRTPHSAVDGGPVRPREHYANIGIGELVRRKPRSFRLRTGQIAGEDLQAVFVRL